MFEGSINAYTQAGLWASPSTNSCAKVTNRPTGSSTGEMCIINIPMDCTGINTLKHSMSHGLQILCSKAGTTFQLWARVNSNTSDWSAWKSLI